MAHRDRQRQRSPDYDDQGQRLIPDRPHGEGRHRKTRLVLRWLLAAFFAAAGYAHLAAPEKLLAITPDWVPAAPQIIFVTGFLEFAGALALVTRPLRTSAAFALALYTVCVWPANIKHAFAGIDLAGLPSSWWYHGPRLALQPFIVWAVLFAGEVIDWPFRKG